MSGNYDPMGAANGEIMRRMFRRRPQGEARQLFPMAPDAPPPMFQPPMEPSGMSQAMPMPPMPQPPPMVPQPPPPAMPPPNPMFGGMPPQPGSMSMGAIPEQTAVGGPDPFARPAPRQMPRAAMPAPADGAMSADQLNMLVMALQAGEGGDGEIANRLRSAMGMAGSMPMAPGVG